MPVSAAGGAGGGDVAEAVGLPAHLVEKFQRQVDARLPGDGGKMEYGIRRGAQGHVDSHGVGHGGGSHDVPGQDLLLQQRHDLHARLLRQTAAGSGHGGNCSVSGEAEAAST